MKNNRGITITSLVIYIALIFVILAILMRVTTYFVNNMTDMADVGFETEFNKINLYLLDETKRTGNGIQEITDNGKQITFLSGNKYIYNADDKVIYLKSKIKICENVERCLFEQTIAENGKKVLSLTITINKTTKTAEYIISYPKTEQRIDELDYTWNITDVATE